MEVVFENAKVLENFALSAGTLQDEATLVFSQEGLTVRFTDLSQISMFTFFLPKSAFKHYSVKGTEKIGLDIDQLASVLHGKSNQELSMQFSGGKVSLVFRGEAVTSSELNNIEISENELPNPKIDYSGSVKFVSGNTLYNAFREAEKFGSHVTLSFEEEGFRVFSYSSCGTTNIVLSYKEKAILDFKVSKTAKSMFPTDYLRKLFAKIKSMQPTIFLKQNAPLKVEWLDGKAEYVFFLAPRIESDERYPEQPKELAIKKSSQEPTQSVEIVQEKPTEKVVSRPIEVALTRLRAIKDIPAFIGTDNCPYYPMKVGDEQLFPERIVKLLLEKKLAVLESEPEPEQKKKPKPVKKAKKPVKVLQPVKLVRAKAKPVLTKRKVLVVRFVLRDPRLIDFVQADRKCFRDKDEQYSTYVRNEKLFSESEEKEQ